jgi:hypothetical protein
MFRVGAGTRKATSIVSDSWPKPTFSDGAFWGLRSDIFPQRAENSADSGQPSASGHRRPGPAGPRNVAVGPRPGRTIQVGRGLGMERHLAHEPQNIEQGISNDEGPCCRRSTRRREIARKTAKSGVGQGPVSQEMQATAPRGCWWFLRLFVAIARLWPFEIRHSLFDILLFRRGMWLMIRLVEYNEAVGPRLSPLALPGRKQIATRVSGIDNRLSDSTLKAARPQPG